MSETTPNPEAPVTADLGQLDEPATTSLPELIPVGGSAPRRSRARTIGLASIVGAVGIGAIAVALLAGGGRQDGTPAAGGGPSQAAAPVGAVSGWIAPAGGDASGGMRLDHGGRGGMGGGMRGGLGGAISITGVDGSKLALKTDNGWTRTIDATGATVTRDGATVALSTLATGDRIVFRETRNTDGTFKITAIEVVQPTAMGTVASVSGSTVTLTQRDGSTTKVVLTSSTTYTVAGQASTVDAVVTGAQVLARGTLAADGTLTASSVVIAPAVSSGTVKEKGSGSLTLTLRDGSTVVVKVTATTTYQVGGVTTPTLADVKVGNVVIAAGTRNADGSLSATVVRSAAAGQFGGPGDGFGRDFGGGPWGGVGRGGMRGGWDFPGFPGFPDVPAPSTAPTSGTNG